MNIAVTGGIGSGKSKVMQLLNTLGYPSFSCDEIYKEIAQSLEYVQEIARIFPSCVQDNCLDRKQLSQIIFTSDKARAQLNAISHPLIMERLLSKMQNCNARFVFAEVPLLFEGKFEKYFDFVIVVQRDLNQRISAIKSRDNLTEKEIYNRIQSQIDYTSKDIQNYFKEKGFYILENNSDIQTLKNQLQNIINLIENKPTVKHIS